MNAYHLSEPAKEDLFTIFSYTLETWGEEQSTTYQSTISDAIERIANDPLLLGSKSRDNVLPGCRTSRVGKHVILYRATSTGVGIARFLHQSMDLPNQVKEQDFN